MQITVLHDTFGHLLRRIAHRHSRLWTELSHRTPLTSPQYSVLSGLMDWEHKHLSAHPDQRTIALAKGIDTSTASDVFRRLESHGWISRTPDAADKRRSRVALTVAGRREVTTVAQWVRALQYDLSPTLSDPERHWVTQRWLQLAHVTDPEVTQTAMLGHALRRVMQHHDHLWAELVSPTRNSVQFAMLATIHRGMASEGLRQADVLAGSGVDRSTGSAILKRLQTVHGVVDARPSEQDKRAKIITLTDAGFAELEQMYPRVAHLQDVLLAPLTTADRERLMMLQQKILDGEV